MYDLAFYNAGCDNTQGPRRVMVYTRRLLRRVLKPIFVRQVELLQWIVKRLDADERSLAGACDDIALLRKRQEEVDERVETILAFGWDYVAMVRRLAVLEDQVASLTGQSLMDSSMVSTPGDESEAKTSILFPGLEVRSKVI